MYKENSERGFKKWFSVSRILVTIWNFGAFCYHWQVIGIDLKHAVILQGSAWLMEFFLCGWYERMLIRNHRNIKELCHLSSERRWLRKYLVFTGIFALVYGTTYYLRLEFFYLIDFGVDKDQLIKSLINMAIFTPIAGYIMGWLVVRRKGRNRRKIEKERWLNKINFGPFTW